MSRKKRDRMKAKAARHEKPPQKTPSSTPVPTAQKSAAGQSRTADAGLEHVRQALPEWRAFYAAVGRAVDN